MVSRGGFVEQKFMLSCSFRSDWICNYHCTEYSHTLLCYLNLT